MDDSALTSIALRDLPEDSAKAALVRRRLSLGLTVDGTAQVLVDDHGSPVPQESAALTLRRARSTRISIDGNAHFCRGLLATRYPGSEADQSPRADETFFPLTTVLRTTGKKTS
jgi:hypothetical protein